MARLAGIALSIGLALTASVASAIEHTVIIYGDGYFPTTIYVQQGDTIRYENKSGQTMTIRIKNVGNMISDLGNNSNAVVTATSGINRTIVEPLPGGDSNSDGQEGFIIFGTAPRSN